MSALQKNTIKYLSVAKFLNGNGFQEQLLLLREFHNRGLNHFFERELKTLRKKIQPTNYDDLLQYHYEKLALEQLAYGHSTATGMGSSSDNIVQILNLMEHYYRAGKVRYLCALRNKAQLSTMDFSLEMPNDMADYFKANENMPIADIKMYYNLYFLLNEYVEGVSYYQNLKKLLHNNKYALPKGEQRQCYIVLFNYCNKRLKEGEQSYLRDIFELFKMAAENEVFLENDTITPAQFYRNTVMSGLRNGEIPWTETFMAKYVSKLSNDKRERLDAYCKAALFFYKGAYDKTLRYLLKFDGREASDYIEHKMLLCKTYYELKEEEALRSLIHSFKNQLRRMLHLPDAAKEPYKAFAAFLAKLNNLQAQPSFDAAKTKMLHSTLNNTAPIAEKEWLLEKVIDLIQNKRTK